MTDGVPTDAPEWADLLEDAAAVAATYREEGWDTVVCEPSAVSPVGDGETTDSPVGDGESASATGDAGEGKPQRPDDRVGLEVIVSAATYDLLASLVENRDGSFDDADVYYRPADGADRRFALVIERDPGRETAVAIPLTYAMSAARPVFETALVEERLLIHVREGDSGGDGTDGDHDAPDRWLTFSHDDPSLFLEESDVREWRFE